MEGHIVSAGTIPLAPASPAGARPRTPDCGGGADDAAGPGPPAADASRGVRGRWWLAGLAGWTLICLVWILDVGLQRQAHGLPFLDSPATLVLLVLLVASGAALTPLVVAGMRRIDADAASRPGRAARYVLLGLGFWIAWSLLQALLTRFTAASATGGFAEHLVHSLGAMSFCAAILYTVMLGLHEAARHLAAARDEELRSARLRTELGRAEGAALQARLQPHFLFNTLHVASGLMDRQPDVARQVLADVAELLRLALERAEVRWVPLRQEIELIERYVFVQRARYRDRLEVRFDIDPDVVDWPVPPLVLQPLVENAVRHGVERRREGGWIEVVARRDDRTLRLAVSDLTAAPAEAAAAPSWRPRQVAEGVGLGSTRARLRLLFGAAARLVTFDRDEGGDGFRVEIDLPWPESA